MQDGKRKVRCIRCGLTLMTVSDPEKVHANCKLECPHRGEAIRTEQCDSCSGKVLIKVFACSKHGECTIGKKIEGVVCCDG